jgi:hypothetical protein
VTLAVSCPRCGSGLRPPSLAHSDWRCDACGPVSPLHAAARASVDVIAGVCARLRSEQRNVPLWCPWPLPSGWMVTGVGWVGDERSGPRGSALALSGPAPIVGGPADTVFVAEEPGVGLGMNLAGAPGPDPGPALRDCLAATLAQAKVRAAGHPTPLWLVPSAELVPDSRSRCAYVGEARGMWLYAVAWPAAAGYLLAESIRLIDLVEALPSELLFGAPSRRLSPNRSGG